MYLKSIEVQGFKSFANKILFEFHNGITGIVGPNGSGKSNVADAVRWVLGEQRAKQLRGGTMQDVIFSGTENRRPLSYASVAITLDNSDHQLPIDYNEVTVTRKLYRSGESEYLINKTACRLKDVHELFYDTGIGKEGYSIIGQGQIDQILSGKPEERRELFDEAAGIVKFKRRKYLSVKKLEDERQNLVRVNDILAELEKQVGPLAKQSETARIYLKKKEELKTFDINLFLMENARLAGQLGELSGKHADTTAELGTARGRYETLKESYGKQLQQLEEAERKTETLRAVLGETVLLHQRLENDIRILEEQMQSANVSDAHDDRRAESIRLEMEAQSARREELAAEMDVLRKELSGISDTEGAVREALEQVQTRVGFLERSVEKKQEDRMQLLNNRASTKAKIQHYKTMLEQIQVRRAQMNKRIIEAKSSSGEQEELLSVYRRQSEDIREEIRACKEARAAQEERIRVLQGEIAGQNEELRTAQSSYHRERSRLETVRNLTERYEGYGNSIRRIMEQKEKERGLYGVVADLIQVEKEYETAIETALGGSIQNIVTDSEETAKRMIAFLKKQKYGRATFLPLTAISRNPGIRQPEALSEPGVIGLASTLVRVEKKYEALADHLLGRTIVAETIDDGIRLARKYRQTLRIVTLEGELLNPGGAMTGGAFKNTSSLLSRRREIEELRENVRRLDTQIRTLQADIEEKKDARTKLYEGLEAAAEQLQTALVTQNTVQMNLEQAKKRQEETEKLVADIRAEGSDLEGQTEEIFENQESIEMELEISVQLEKELERAIAGYQEELEQAKAEETLALQKAENIRLKAAGLEQKVQFLRENEKQIEERSAAQTEELRELQASKSARAGERAEKEAQIAALRQRIAASEETRREQEAAIEECVSQKETLHRKSQELLEQREALAEHLAALDKELFRLESQRTLLEEQQEKQILYMWEEYELTLSDAQKLRMDGNLELSALKREIQRMKAEIRQLGAVNVNAIEDYKEVSERFEFLKGQHEDLVEAEKTLVQIIEELDAAMRRQFRERFEEISREFDSVFRQLFGGGKGTLELIEDEDILEAGIRIIAQPPGKKLQNMMQLSGGEKALTAISLLFAIQNLKPSPFCLLDEIEAALDDSNVTRFAKYLHKLTTYTQFIVITHRRGTMTAADRLYGITMQEKGVSTLVSVNLLEHELDK